MPPSHSVSKQYIEMGRWSYDARNATGRGLQPWKGLMGDPQMYKICQDTIGVPYEQNKFTSFSRYYCINPQNAQKQPGKKSPSIAPPANIIQRQFDPSLIIYQRIRVGQFGPTYQQGDKVGHFLYFVSVFCLIFAFNPKVSNFGLLACILDELYTQNLHPMFTYNIPGTSSLIFIGF